MNYSYLMGVDDVTELKKLGFNVVKVNNNYQVMFEVGKEKIYEDFLNKNLKNGYWNEYLGDKIVFNFKFLDGSVKKYVFDKDNEEEIFHLCCEFAGCTFSSLEQMLKDNSFYAKY